MIYFEMVGNLKLPKETDSFKALQEREFNSGWINKTLNFNVVSGTNTFFMRTRGGHHKNKNTDIYVFSKPTVDDDGKRSKGKSFTIPFDERKTSPLLGQVAEWKKFKLDLSNRKLRYKANKLLKSEDPISENDLKELNISTVEELKKLYQKEEKKVFEFISEWDYIDLLKKILDSGKYEHTKFHISGTVDCDYSERDGRWYINYSPNNIRLANSDETDSATANLTLLLNEDSIDDSLLDDKGKYYITGYSMEYYSPLKKNLPMPYTFTLKDGKDKKTERLLKRFFEIKNGVYQLGIVVKLINGASVNEITLEDLDEETREDIELGILDFEDVKAELGGSVFGDRVTESQFLKIGRGFSKGKEETDYSDSDLVVDLTPKKDLFEDSSSTSSSSEDEEEDLFDDLFD